MRTCYLDCRDMTDRAALHACLREALSLPDWYGNNLDALYDCLSEPGEETTIVVTHTQALDRLEGDYGRRFLDTLVDASRENPALRVLAYWSVE